MRLHKTIRFAWLFLLLAGVFPVFAQESSPTLKKIQETGTVVLGYREASIPFSYAFYDKNKKLQIVGYAIDLCHKMVDEIRDELKMPNLKVAYRTVTPNTRILLLSEGAIDIECGSSTNTAVRQRYASFSTTYYLTGVRLATKRDSSIHSVRDVDKNKAIAVTEGSSGSRVMSQLNAGRKSEKISLMQAKDHSEGFQMMVSGKTAAFANDGVLLYGLIAASKTPEDYTVSEEVLSVEPYGAMIPKDDRPFKAVVDRAIRKVFESGEIEGLYKKWFMLPIPPKEVVLNIPKGKQMNKIFERPTDQSDPRFYQ